MSLRSIAACATLIVGLFVATAAQAVTINTYSFTQDGYFSDTLPSGQTGILTGSFSGTVPDFGIMTKADLTGFSYTFTIYNFDNTVFDTISNSGLADLAGFAYTPLSGASTLFISDQSAVGVCVGLAAAYEECGEPSGHFGAFAFLNNGQPIIPGSGATAFLVSDTVPQIALTGVTTTPVATTPIPATLPLFASALGGLGLFRWRRTRGRALAVA